MADNNTEYCRDLRQMNAAKKRQVCVAAFERGDFPALDCQESAYHCAAMLISAGD
ncbi:hypothetical protein [Pantoea sp. B65]|uniref:hypothetical protein n=1 Tax=Pantoea sp. B65 TaxID=2813359 RepID=UPI0039B5BCD7